MSTYDGNRVRYFRERKAVEHIESIPLRAEVSSSTRRRIFREIRSYAWKPGLDGEREDLTPLIVTRSNNVLDLPVGEYGYLSEDQISSMGIDDLLTFVEIAIDIIYHVTRDSQLSTVIQSILRDDASSFRLRRSPSASDTSPYYEIIEIGNPHLGKEIIDRTYELTRLQALSVAQRDYANAWASYSRGDFVNALVEAHKAFESAAKAIIKKLDSARNPDQDVTKKLVESLKALRVFPDRGSGVLNALEQVFTSSGSLRNAPGAAHGSVSLSTPDGNIALLGIHLSGSFIFYIAQQYEIMTAEKNDE